MTSIIMIILLILWIFAIYKIVNHTIKKSIDYKAKTEHKQKSENSEETEAELPIAGAYQQKWMFTYNEKNAYNKLKPIAEELGYTVFAKVRLLDLVEPIKGKPKYKTYLYKIQAKHIDFVLCNQKLVAKYLIELDDNSHNAADRIQRDKFVDEVVQSVGYKIIHTREITEEIRTLLSPENN